jgi:hypothetical protein
MSRDLSSLFCTVVIALTLTFLTTVVSEPTPSPNDKCVSIRLDDSQRIYLTGSGQKGAVGTRGLPGKIGPKGDKGEKGFRGRVGPEGKKGSKGNDSGITELERRLVVAEQMIAELQNVTDMFRKYCNTTIFESCKDALENRCSANGVYYLKPATVSMPFRVRFMVVNSIVLAEFEVNPFTTRERHTHALSPGCISVVFTMSCNRFLGRPELVTS